MKSLAMKDLNEALTEITAIRQQIVDTAEFRGHKFRRFLDIAFMFVEGADAGDAEKIF